MTRPIVLWGATGQAKVLAEFLPALGYEIVALFDSDMELISPFARVPLYAGWSGFERWRAGAPGDFEFLVAIGGSHGADRVAMFDRLVAEGLRPGAAVHTHAYVSETARLGGGCQILVGAIVGADATLGKSCIVNTKASIDHECVVGDGVHVAPGATLCGAVIVEDEAFIGANTVILPRLRVGRAAVVGAGAVVTKDVPSGVVVVGNPAKVAKNVR